MVEALPAAGGGDQEASGEGQQGWLGAAACLNRFRGFSESILKSEKKCHNALMNRYFYPPLLAIL